uniref:Tubulin alpha chain n=1 Tax=Ciona savignyi TaxID=51511 RepID=H2ZI38_CIOSA
REVISVHIGQAGIEIGKECWELYCLEHAINVDGSVSDTATADDPAFGRFFYKNESGRFIARACFSDFEPTCIDGVKTGKYKSLFDPQYLHASKEDSGNNFARGYLTMGNKNINQTVAGLFKLAEACDSLQGFMIYHSLGGGTGSGFTSVLMERLTAHFGNKSKCEIAIFPGDKISAATVEPYNAVLATHGTLTHSECSFLFDNEAVFDICTNKLGIERPGYPQINKVVAQVMSSITASLRFEGSLNANLTDFRTNLVPNPRLRFPLVNFAPFASAQTTPSGQMSVTDMTNACFDTSNAMVKCNPLQGKYMACCMTYRGNAKQSDINAVIETVKQNQNIQFFDWIPKDIQVWSNHRKPTMLPESDMAKLVTSVCALSNTTAMAPVWTKLRKRFDMMYSRRAFIHWYKSEGVLQDQFDSAREDLVTLEKDYENVSSAV